MRLYTQGNKNACRNTQMVSTEIPCVRKLISGDIENVWKTAYAKEAVSW